MKPPIAIAIYDPAALREIAAGAQPLAIAMPTEETAEPSPQPAGGLAGLQRALEESMEGEPLIEQ